MTGLFDTANSARTFSTCSLLLFAYRTGGILNMKKNLGPLDLFESGSEAGNQRVGKVSNEPNRIGEKNLAAGRKLQLSQLRVKRRKHASRFEHARLRERVEESALPRVRVTDKSDYWNRDSLTSLALLMANAADSVELRLDVVEPEVDLTAIGLEVGSRPVPEFQCRRQAATWRDRDRPDEATGIRVARARPVAVPRGSWHDGQRCPG